MAPHSSTLAWKIPWTEESGRLQSMGSRRVRHDWETSLSLFTFMHWRRKWQTTPVFLPGESRDKVAQSQTSLKWLSSSSSKILMKAIENNTNGWKQIWCSWIRRINVVIDSFTFWTSPVAQTVKKLPAMQEIQVWWALGWEEPLEKGKGYPLQYSCLEKSMDRRAWQATVPGCKELDAAKWLILSFSFTQGNLQI